MENAVGLHRGNRTNWTSNSKSVKIRSNDEDREEDCGSIVARHLAGLNRRGKSMSRLVRCIEGHIFEEEKGPDCPICGAATSFARAPQLASGRAELPEESKTVDAFPAGASKPVFKRLRREKVSILPPFRFRAGVSWRVFHADRSVGFERHASIRR